jgi:hypothetical protein
MARKRIEIGMVVQFRPGSKPSDLYTGRYNGYSLSRVDFTDAIRPWVVVVDAQIVTYEDCRDDRWLTVMMPDETYAHATDDAFRVYTTDAY